MNAGTFLLPPDRAGRSGRSGVRPASASASSIRARRWPQADRRCRRRDGLACRHRRRGGADRRPCRRRRHRRRWRRCDDLPWLCLWHLVLHHDHHARSVLLSPASGGPILGYGSGRLAERGRLGLSPAPPSTSLSARITPTMPRRWLHAAGRPLPEWLAGPRAGVGWGRPAPRVWLADLHGAGNFRATVPFAGPLPALPSHHGPGMERGGFTLVAQLRRRHSRAGHGLPVIATPGRAWPARLRSASGGAGAHPLTRQLLADTTGCGRDHRMYRTERSCCWIVNTLERSGGRRLSLTCWQRCPAMSRNRHAPPRSPARRTCAVRYAAF